MILLFVQAKKIELIIFLHQLPSPEALLMAMAGVSSPAMGHSSGLSPFSAPFGGMYGGAHTNLPFVFWPPTQQPQQTFPPALVGRHLHPMFPGTVVQNNFQGINQNCVMHRMSPQDTPPQTESNNANSSRNGQTLKTPGAERNANSPAKRSLPFGADKTLENPKRPSDPLKIASSRTTTTTG